MTSIVRIGIARLGYNNLTRQLCKVTAASNVTQVAFITGKVKRAGKRPWIKPYDYLNKEYGFWDQLFDPMVDRMDENSKVIVVEGPIAAGKSKLAEKLADELDMVYLPPPTFDEYYITEYGYDLRTLDDRLSPGAQSCDLQKFLKNPYHPNAQMFQLHYLQLKYDQYITALLHLTSTGQGVVLNRSFYTDYIYAKAMTNAGYMSRESLVFYNNTIKLMRLEMLRPHLIVYLDIPVNVVQERIKKRAIPYEVNSEVLTTQYLIDIENSYKLDYLKDIITHSHVLVYDWTNEGDVTTMVEDIEMLNFDDYEKRDEKLADWRFQTVQALRSKRCYYQDRYWLHADYNRPEHDAPELSYTAEQDKERDLALKTVPAWRYAEGFNSDAGDKGILWKSKLDHRLMTLRPNARDIKVLEKEIKRLQAIAMH